MQDGKQFSNLSQFLAAFVTRLQTCGDLESAAYAEQLISWLIASSASEQEGTGWKERQRVCSLLGSIASQCTGEWIFNETEMLDALTLRTKDSASGVREAAVAALGCCLSNLAGCAQVCCDATNIVGSCK
jgi:hypothetical protein